MAPAFLLQDLSSIYSLVEEYRGGHQRRRASQVAGKAVLKAAGLCRMFLGV